jgi:molybdopterin molybdotransferase
MQPPIPLAEAQARLLALAAPRPAENLALERALGRYLAAPLAARRTQPAADLSAMDGYAMRGDDLSGPWTVVGESAAGHPFGGSLAPGQTIRISTGALLPADAGVVLLQENATRDGDALSLNGEGDPSPQHVRRAGFDFADGDPLLPTGTRLGPAQIALALSGGHGTAHVHALPSIAVLDSGDELAADPANCAPYQIPASNGAMLAAMAAPYAASLIRLGPVPDTLDAMANALDRASDADVIVTSGGASVGDHDLVRPALEAWGAEIDFWRVAIKPGKPLLIACKGRQIVVGLPGNPVSSFVTAQLFLLPLLRKLAGAANPLPRIVSAQLDGSVPPGGNRLEFLRARWHDGRLRPITQQDSSALRALSAADALVERPIDAPATGDGDAIRAYLLDNGGIA